MENTKLESIEKQIQELGYTISKLRKEQKQEETIDSLFEEEEKENLNVIPQVVEEKEQIKDKVSLEEYEKVLKEKEELELALKNKASSSFIGGGSESYDSQDTIPDFAKNVGITPTEYTEVMKANNFTEEQMIIYAKNKQKYKNRM